MSQPNVYTLTCMVREFNNQLTVRALSEKLGISRSTLSRCKNGVWPRSIKLEAMRTVFEECREQYFGDDGDALVRAAILYMRSQGVDTLALEQINERLGYEAFLDALLSHAQSGEPLEPLPPEEDESSETDATPATSPLAQSQGLIFAIPLAVVLLVGLLNLSITTLLTWAIENRTAFVLLSLVIALLPAITGTLIDAPLAWRTYKRDHPEVRLSWKAFASVSHYGDEHEVIPGAGRFNLSSAYLAYQPVCNVLGAMCYIALLYFLITLPGFVTFYHTHEWMEFFKASIAVAFCVAFGQMRDESSRPKVTDQANEFAENPDAYLPTRVHTWANLIHLVWTISLAIMLLLSLVSYSIVRFRTVEVPLLMLWPIAQAMAFLAYASISPIAVRVRATSVGIFVPGVLAVSAGFCALILVCYLPSWTLAAVLLLCVLCAIGALTWSHTYAKRGDTEWLKEGSRSRAYSLAIATCLLCLLVIGLATQVLR